MCMGKRVTKIHTMHCIDHNDEERKKKPTKHVGSAFGYSIRVFRFSVTTLFYWNIDLCNVIKCLFCDSDVRLDRIEWGINYFVYAIGRNRMNAFAWNCTNIADCRILETAGTRAGIFFSHFPTIIIVFQWTLCRALTFDPSIFWTRKKKNKQKKTFCDGPKSQHHNLLAKANWL